MLVNPHHHEDIQYVIELFGMPAEASVSMEFIYLMVYKLGLATCLDGLIKKQEGLK